MTKIELVGYDYCPFLQPSIITLNEKHAAFIVTYIEPNDMPDWVTAVSPLGATPFLLVDRGALFESAAMNEFANEVTDGDLHPDNAFKKAQNRMWISRSYELLNHIYALKTTSDQTVFDAEKGRLKTKLAAIDEAIDENPFFNGREFCLVDGAYAPVLRTIAMLDDQFSTGLIDGLANVERWSNNILNRPSVQASVVKNYDTKSATKIALSGAILSRQHSSPAAQVPKAQNC